MLGQEVVDEKLIEELPKADETRLNSHTIELLQITKWPRRGRIEIFLNNFVWDRHDSMLKVTTVLVN